MDAVPTEQIVTAKPASDVMPVIYVWGRREGQVGKATTASEGAVSYSDYSLRPLLRPGELAEVVPGLAATQHSGEGKANQYFLRGFNLDHGTDFSISLDGVPLNLRTNAHGQGYLDINPITPELIAAIAYRKGTYAADSGDFSAAGTAAFTSQAHLRRSLVQVQAGGDGFARVVAAGRLNDDGYVAIDTQRNDGPWTTAENLHKLTLQAHYRLGDWQLNGLAYQASWNSADQIPQRAVTSGVLSYLGVVDPSDGGKTRRIILSVRQRTDDADLVVYAQAYRLNLWSDFTYFLDDPEHGDQFEQAEQRTILGGSYQRHWTMSPRLSLAAGGDVRHDDIGHRSLRHPSAPTPGDAPRRRCHSDLGGGVEPGRLAVRSCARQPGPASRLFA